LLNVKKVEDNINFMAEMKSFIGIRKKNINIPP